MKKKILSLLICISLVMSLSACSKKEEAVENAGEVETNPVEEQVSEPKAVNEAIEDTKEASLEQEEQIEEEPEEVREGYYRSELTNEWTDEKIKNSSELEFAVFCIENVAVKLGVDAERVYQAFTEQSDILNGYIVPEYEVLHTQSREYIVDDLLDVMKERGVEV